MIVFLPEINTVIAGVVKISMKYGTYVPPGWTGVSHQIAIYTDSENMQPEITLPKHFTEQEAKTAIRKIADAIGIVAKNGGIVEIDSACLKVAGVQNSENV